MLAVDEAVALDSGWAVLDGTEAVVHILDAQGALVRSVGGRGDGPGELRAPRLLAGDGGLVWVVGSDSRIDRFDASGAFLGRSTLVLETCRLPELQVATALDGRLHLAVRCILDRDRRLLLAAVDEDGAGRTLLDLPSPSGERLSIHRLSLTAAGGHLALGTGRGRCALVVDADGRPAGAGACMEGEPLPLPPSMRRDLRGELGQRFRAMGVPVEVPHHLPWFDRLFEGPDGSVLERTRPEPGTWPIPVGVELHAGRGRLLLVHQGMDGLSTRTVAADSLPWAPLEAARR